MDKGFELRTPVAFVIFNRPDCVLKSFESIRNARPRKLFIIADGPRDDHPDDRRLCDECREIVENIDWDCDVQRNYSDVNLGCGMRPASGFSWVFSQADEAIILEDDCVPSMDFYRFCQEMLERYRHDAKVLSVSGVGFGYGSENGTDCFFSRFNNTLGWATWKRVWDMYDYRMTQYPSFKGTPTMRELLLREDYVDYWQRVFDEVYEGRTTSVWDAQFMFLSFQQRGLHLYPKKNMVQYIGWGGDSTHCKGGPSPESCLSLLNSNPESISFPVNAPVDVADDFLSDCRMMEGVYGVPVNPGLLHRNDISGADLEAMKSAENLIIYGAGKYCKELICFLEKKGINRFLIAVTKTAGDKYIMGNKVVGIETLIPKKERSLVVIAVKSQSAAGDMKNELSRLGFPHYFAIGDATRKEAMISSASAIDKKLRDKKKRKKKIKVLFICHRPQVWGALKTVYEAFVNDSFFDVSIVAIPTKKCFPSIGFNHDEYENTGAEDFFKNAGCVHGYDYHSKSWLDLKSLLPDYVFYQQPYNVMRSEEYNSQAISKYAKVCYVAYGYEMMRGKVIEGSHPDDFFQSVTYYFAQDTYNQDYMHDYLKRMNNTYTRTILVGYPKFDLIKTERSFCKGAGLKAVWTPRWSEDEGNCNFYDYGKWIADFFAETSNAELLFRPHPQMMINIRSSDDRKEQRLESLVSYITNSRHCRMDTDMEYTPSFEWSDCMITDMTSLMGDYFLTGKPIIYCHKVDIFSEAGKNISDGFYWVKNQEELEKTLRMLARGEDPLFEKRQQIIKGHYYLPEKGAGYAIKEFIKSDAQK